MKKITRNHHFSLLAAALLLSTNLAMATESPVAGKQYKLLKPPQPTNVEPGKIEVVEVFWYACGHCYVIEPAVESWNKKGRADNVQLIQMPATWNDLLKIHARAFYTVETLGKPELHNEIFREINVRGNRLDTTEKLEDFFASKGVSNEEFMKTYNSFPVETSVRRAEELNRRYQITSTPTFIVNGKYKTDVGMAGSEEKLFETINALAAMETPAG
jgi:protein dithiol oxidoreductase (disulfide-forming)